MLEGEWIVMVLVIIAKGIVTTMVLAILPMEGEAMMVLDMMTSAINRIDWCFLNTLFS